jgi:hypothetical protein
MSEYPITEIIIKEKDQELSEKAREKWDHLLNVVLDLRRVMIQINADLMIYGQSFYYLYYPFTRYAKCSSCGTRTQLSTMKDARCRPSFDNRQFKLQATGACSHCSPNNESRTFDIEDKKSEARSGLTLVHVDPLRMELEYNPASGARRWYWTPPKRLRDGLANGDRTVCDTTELKVLEAVFHNSKILLNKDRLYVAQTDQQPGVWEGWGTPPFFCALEDVYYTKVLRRANEALAQEHVTPIRFLSPAGTGDVAPQRTMNLSDWQNRIRTELFKFKKDPNHIMVSPLPINVEQIGGQARTLMVSSEIEASMRTVAAAIGCPLELIYGGLNWSGASVTLRVMENHMIGERESSERLLDFLTPKLAAYFKLPRVKTELSDFKVADDTQVTANKTNLMIQGFLSREAVLPELGHNPDTEFKRLKEEHARLNQITMEDNIASSHMNTVIQALEAKAQVLLQYELQSLQMNMAAQSEREHLARLNAHVQELHAKGMTSPVEFEQSASLLQRIDPNLASMILQSWQTTMPNVSLLIQQKMRQSAQQAAFTQQGLQQPGGPAFPGAAGGSELQSGMAGPYNSGQLNTGGNPLPTQRPPRSNNPQM